MQQMNSWRKVGVGVLILMIGLTLPSYALGNDDPPEEEDLSLSPYWEYRVSRFEDVIVHYAEKKGVDPNLLAAVIYTESKGNPNARSAVGAVGLMQLMPWSGRPSLEKLQDPWVNVAWGSNALAHIIEDGHGDVFYALAAYNGGWDQVYLPITRNYAASVLGYYAKATAVQQGLPADGNWRAVIAPDPGTGSRSLTVIPPECGAEPRPSAETPCPYARYTYRPWLRAQIPSIPETVPHTTAFTYEDENGQKRQIHLWLVPETDTLAETWESSPHAKIYPALQDIQRWTPTPRVQQRSP